MCWYTLFCLMLLCINSFRVQYSFCDLYFTIFDLTKGLLAEHIQLPAKLLDYFLWSNNSHINLFDEFPLLFYTNCVVVITEYSILNYFDYQWIGRQNKTFTWSALRTFFFVKKNTAQARFLKVGCFVIAVCTSFLIARNSESYLFIESAFGQPIVR